MSLTISNLVKRYDDHWVLRDVSFQVERGEVFGIFGSTAAGKSTLIRLLSGAERCSGGNITYDTKDVTTLSCNERNFHFPRLTNTSIWEKLFKSDKRPQIADGEGQVVALDQALENADSVLLLDDSFCYMDRLLRHENYQKLRRRVKEKNLIVVIASNDFEEVMLLCDRIAVLAEGTVKQIGTPREIYENPNSYAVARICGRNNIFQARRLTSTKAEHPEFQTLIGEHRLSTQRTEKVHLGAINQNVCLMIRPEHISISFGASFPEDNLLKARIVEIRFHGATTLIVLDSNGLLLEALVLRLVGLKIGDECMVGLPPDRISVLKD
ncbi:MAG: ABC transporter ATP-binding protein [Pyrinomonadaceae bacterium]|nr:ABC transporter ATP-binding protein [Pyrinomonadaceae bacterium]